MGNIFSVNPEVLKKEADNLNILGNGMTGLYNRIREVERDLRYDFSHYSGVLESLDICASNIKRNQNAIFRYSSLGRRSALYYERAEESVINNMNDSLFAFFINSWHNLVDRILYWGIHSNSFPRKAGLYNPPVSVGSVATGLGIYSILPYNDSKEDKLSISWRGGKFSDHTEINGMDVGQDGEYHIAHLTSKTKKGANWDIDKGQAKVEYSNTTKFSAIDGKLTSNVGLLKSELEGSVGNVAATGAVGLTLFSDGKFTPSVYGKVKAKANVAEGSVTDTFGTDDYNVHAKAEGTLLGAEAQAEAQVGRIVDDETGEVKWGAKGKAGAEAYVAQGELSGGFTLFGIKVDATVEGKLGGAGVKAGGEVTTNAVEGELGLGLLAGLGIKVKVDWSKAKWPWQE
ncbi:MAG: hypothetical protein K5673_07210 [Lachnospiraceae bacterium]|nr:hypothetical protein [Lachnospiraceae bacterium]